MQPSRGPILAATDFSESAALAAREARALSQATGSPLELIHVVESTGVDLAAVTAPWLAAAGLASHRITLREGTAWLEIVRRALELAASVVVVGGHGRRGYQPLAAGSTTQRLLLRSPAPVLVVSAPQVAKSLRWDVSSVDFAFEG